MSKRYIDVETLISQLEKVQFDIEDSIYSKGFGGATETFLGILRKYPTADVVEVRRGEWILEKEPNGKPYCFHCSVCDDEFRHIEIKTKTPYCPNCGAKMDGERREE